MTNGVTAMLLRVSDPDGALLGIRVRWTINSSYLGCQFSTLRVELNNNEVGKNVSVNETFKDFLGADRLDCNREYKPRVEAFVIASSTTIVSQIDYGAPLFYGSKCIINNQS